MGIVLAAVLVVVVMAAFFLIPMFPFNTTVGSGGALHVQAWTSVSYAIFRCGVVVTPVITQPASFGTGAYHMHFAAWTGMGWICGTPLFGYSVL
jgi:hypothetical protein